MNYPTYPEPVTATQEVLEEVAAERIQQDRKWGEQNHPDGTGPDLTFRGLGLPVLHGAARADWMAVWAKARCQRANEEGGDTFERILTEEWAELVEAPAGSAALRKELIQVAAVAVAWLEAIDRREVK